MAQARKPIKIGPCRGLQRVLALIWHMCLHASLLRGAHAKGLGLVVLLASIGLRWNGRSPQTNKNGKWGNKHESVKKLPLFGCTWAVFAVRDLRTLSRIAPFHLRPRWENDIPFNHVASFFFLQVVAGDAVRKQCSLDATLNLKNREISRASFVPINHPPGKQKHHQGCVSFGRLCAAVLLCYPRAVPVHVCRGVVGAAALGFNESLTGDHCAQKVDYG